MELTFINKLIAPSYPKTALGIEGSHATAVSLSRYQQSFRLRRAATLKLTSDLVRPSFDESNIMDRERLGDHLAELVTSAGLGKHRRWSVALPEATSRSMTLTLESVPASRGELEEVLSWKTERGFGIPLSELAVARARLNSDSADRRRYLVVGVRALILREYEGLFESLGWKAGLILPRYIGELQWLASAERSGDALLVTSHDVGFTAVIVRSGKPLFVRSVVCEEADCYNELFRLILYYRDRIATVDDEQIYTIERLMNVKNGFAGVRAAEVLRDTLGVELKPFSADDADLEVPPQLSFDSLAAAAGLARFAWT